MRAVLYGAVAIVALILGGLIGFFYLPHEGLRHREGVAYRLSRQIATRVAASRTDSDPREALWSKLFAVRPGVTNVANYRVIPFGIPTELSDSPPSLAQVQQLCDRLPEDRAPYRPRLLTFSGSYGDLLSGVSRIPTTLKTQFGQAASDVINVGFRRNYSDGYSTYRVPACNIGGLPTWRSDGLALIAGRGLPVSLSEIFADFEAVPANLSSDGKPYYRAYLMRVGVLDFSRPGWFHPDLLRDIASQDSRIEIDANIRKATFGTNGRLALIPAAVYVFQPITQATVDEAGRKEISDALTGKSQGEVHSGKLAFKITAGRLQLREKTSSFGGESMIPGHVYAVALIAQRRP